jgi:hypothetical protein
MMAPGPEAPWYDVGENWCETIMYMQDMLGIDIPINYIDARWQEAEARRELQTLRELAALLAEVMRKRRADESQPREGPAL